MLLYYFISASMFGLETQNARNYPVAVKPVENWLKIFESKFC